MVSAPVQLYLAGDKSMTHYLRFNDESAAMAAIADAGLMADGPDGPTPILASHTHALDMVGIIVKDGKPLNGWHVNYIGELPDGWEQYRVNPRDPARVFG